MQGNEIYSDKITQGSRTYFFDIKTSQNGDFYIKISESKRTENGFEHQRIIVFEEDLKEFDFTFKKALNKFKQLKEPKRTDSKTYSVEKIRETFSQAYLPWTQEDDDKLELLFCENINNKELSHIFGRNEGAINSRIKKLELKEKYGK